MCSFFYPLVGYFLTPGGLFLAALDSALIFFLPLGIDFAVIILAARKTELFRLYALIATPASLAGAAFTFRIGHKIGEHGLTKLIKPSRLARVQNASATALPSAWPHSASFRRRFRSPPSSSRAAPRR